MNPYITILCYELVHVSIIPIRILFIFHNLNVEKDNIDHDMLLDFLGYFVLYRLFLTRNYNFTDI